MARQGFDILGSQGYKSIQRWSIAHSNAVKEWDSSVSLNELIDVAAKALQQ